MGRGANHKKTFAATVERNAVGSKGVFNLQGERTGAVLSVFCSLRSVLCSLQ